MDLTGDRRPQVYVASSSSVRRGVNAPLTTKDEGWRAKTKLSVVFQVSQLRAASGLQASSTATCLRRSLVHVALGLRSDKLWLLQATDSRSQQLTRLTVAGCRRSDCGRDTRGLEGWTRSFV